MSIRIKRKQTIITNTLPSHHFACFDHLHKPEHFDNLSTGKKCFFFSYLIRTVYVLQRSQKSIKNASIRKRITNINSQHRRTLRGTLIMQTKKIGNLREIMHFTRLRQHCRTRYNITRRRADLHE